MKKIDIHTHITAFPQTACPRKWAKHTFLGLEDQLKVHDNLNVDLGVILPIIAPDCQWMTMSNEEVKFIVDQRPDRYTWFCNVDPRQGDYSPDSDLEYIVHHYKSLGAKGLGELTTPLYADDPMMDNLFSACERLQMPVLIHIAPQHGGDYGIVDELGLPRIEKMLKKHKDMKLIGHSAAFWCEISEGVTQEERNGYPKGKVKEGRLPKLLREYGNLYCDISAGSGENALMRDPEYAAKFLTEFQDRIYYGADVCIPTQTNMYDFDKFFTNMVETGMITREVYEKIIRKNAVKLLGIKE